MIRQTLTGVVLVAFLSSCADGSSSSSVVLTFLFELTDRGAADRGNGAVTFRFERPPLPPSRVPISDYLFID
jgi:hypothetical protein